MYVSMIQGQSPNVVLLIRRRWARRSCAPQSTAGAMFQKTVWQFLLKVQIHLSYDPAILLLREMKTYLHIKTSTWIFTAALFITAPNRKELVFSGWMVQQTVVCPFNGILFCNEKEGTTSTCNTLDGSQGHAAEWKKANLERLSTLWFISKKWTFKDEENGMYEYS